MCSSDLLISAIDAALEGFTGIGANTVTVTGTRAAGFAIEFAGARAGQDLSAITLSYEPQVATASVAVTQQGEVKQTGTTTSGTNVRERQVISFSGATTNTNVALTVTTAAATGTIYDDGSDPDGAGGNPAYDDDRPSFAINDVTVNEAATATNSGPRG